jgi:Flp pilus assembly protein TadB
MAQQSSKRRSRKARNHGSAPRAVPSTRRDERARRRAEAAREVKRADRRLGREGDRPDSPFGGLPISEVAILIGFAGLVVGFIEGGGPPLIVGLIVVGLGTMEITAREHFAGYRSHTFLLAAIPAAAAIGVLVALFGVPRQRPLVLLGAVPLYLILFWLLRKRFAAARQARVARPPAS